jgi:hypothetical protein
MLTGHVLPHLTNMSHTVHRVSFGPAFPGQVTPLDGTVRMEQPGGKPHAYKYYLKIVPTSYTTRLGAVVETHQYSVSEYAVPLGAGTGRADPFLDLVYDLSPIVMRVHQSPLGLLHFVVRLCAVVGGALSVTRLFDKLVDGAARAMLGPAAGEQWNGGGGSGGGALSGGLLPTSSGGGARHKTISSTGGSYGSYGPPGGGLPGALSGTLVARHGASNGFSSMGSGGGGGYGGGGRYSSGDGGSGDGGTFSPLGAGVAVPLSGTSSWRSDGSLAQRQQPPLQQQGSYQPNYRST